MQYNREEIINRLKNRGLTNLDSITDKDLIKLYNQVITEWTNNIISFSGSCIDLKNIDISYLDRVVSSIVNLVDFYDVFEKLLYQYSYADIKEALLNNVKSAIFDKSLIILDIKYTQYQELMIEEIEKLLTSIPEEEKHTFLRFIEENKDNYYLLKKILEQLRDNKILSTIGSITNIKKYILSNFMPSDLEKNYKEYFNLSEEKQKLIATLKKMNVSYSKKQLDLMTKQDLIEIIDSIKQKEMEDIKNNEDFNKYSALINQCLYKDDTHEFEALVFKILEDASQDCISKLRNYFKLRDPLFESKFKMASIKYQEFDS